MRFSPEELERVRAPTVGGQPHEGIKTKGKTPEEEK